MTGRTKVVFGPTNQSAICVDGFRVVHFVADARIEFVIAEEDRLFISLAYRPYCIIGDSDGILWVYGNETRLHDGKVIWPIPSNAEVPLTPEEVSS